MAENVYVGPGKVLHGAGSLHPDGPAGEITFAIDQAKVDFGNATFGRIGSLQGGTLARVSFTPFGSWGALGTVYPARIGVTVGATTAALAIGARPHGAAGANVATKIWTRDGRLYDIKRTAIIGHPELHLGIDKSAFGGIEIVGIPVEDKPQGTAASFYALTASGGADPTSAFDPDEIIQGPWTGVWGTAGGFGGDAGAAIQAEDEWVIVPEISYSPVSVQGQIVAYTLDSVAFMARVRPYGPTQAQIDAAIGLHSGRLLGSRLAGSDGEDLVLTNQDSNTVTLKNCVVHGAGFNFGGSKLGNGEIGFVSQMTFTAGVPDALLEFSA